MDYNLIIDRTYDVFIECNVRSFPVDCFSVLAHYGYKTYTYQQVKQSNERLFAICKKYSSDAFRYRNMICYNQRVIDSRIRFSLMHELGHILLNHVGNSPENEDEADCFASNLLAPRIAMDRTYCYTADDTHNKFGLSYAAANRALIDYKKWCLRDKTNTDFKIANLFFPKPTANTIVQNPEINAWDKKTEINQAPVQPSIYEKELRRIRRKHRKIQKQMKECEERARFLQQYCDVFAMAEDYKLYGDDL